MQHSSTSPTSVDQTASSAASAHAAVNHGAVNHGNDNDVVSDPLFRDHHAMMVTANLIYYLILALLLGLVLREVNKKTKFPYSPMVLTAGIFLGLLQQNIGFLGVSTKIMSQMHPHIILFIFIPILLFESAFNCDWFVFRRLVKNILLLAGPGVLVGSLLVGVVFKLVLQYPDEDMTWYQAFTLGSVISATDPVAVVALLKELGATLRFNVLIEGESLFNDGFAMVFFAIFSNLSKGNDLTVGGVTVDFLRNSLVGPCIGILLGFLASLWTRRVLGDDIQVTWLTFVFTYLTFYLCEFTFFHTSGVLGVICLGLFWSAFGKTNIRPEIEHAVHTVWAFIQYSTDTLIFLLCGIIIGTVVIEEVYIVPADWPKIFVFYFLMILCRFVMILFFYPLLRVFGYPISKSELIVLVYGGLRGALGICLALMVGVDDEFPARFRHLTVFYLAAMTALTNLINGTTCKTLVKYMKMIEESAVRKKIYKNYLKELIFSSNEKQKELATDRFFTMVDWRNVKQLTGTEQLAQDIADLDVKPDLDRRQNNNSTYEGISESEMFGEVRYRILRILKGLYLQKFEEGKSEGDACRLLVESSNICLDSTTSMLNIWEVLQVNFTSLGFIQYFFRAVVIGKFAKSYITRNLRFIYDTTSTFISCGNEALLLLHHLPVNKNAIKAIQEELQSDINKAEVHLAELNTNFSEVLRAIQTRRASYSVLMHMKHHLDHTHESGLVDDIEYKMLNSDVKTRLVALENFTFNWVAPTFNSYINDSPLFQMLYENEIAKIKSCQFEKRFQPGELMYETGMTCQYLYIINIGNVKDQLSKDISEKKEIGSILSYANILAQSGKCVSTCRAVSECVCNAISIDVIQSIMQSNQDFEEKVCTNSVDYLVRIYAAKAGPLAQFDERRLLEFFKNHAQFRRLDAHAKIEFPNGGYIFKGECQSQQDQSRKFGEFQYVPPKEGELIVADKLLALIFDIEIRALEQSQIEKFNLEGRESEIDRKYQQGNLHQINRDIEPSAKKFDESYFEVDG